MSDIGRWLDRIGFGQYAAAFDDNAVDFEVLPELTDADLRELGVPLGHRKKLLKAIASLPVGTKVAEDIVSPQGAAADSLSEEPAGERRQLTVMFCDLVGSTALSERLDPEDLRELLRGYQGTCAQAIERFDGHIAKYIGDGLLIYFGYPRAHEDDAQRAVRAGLAIVEGIGPLNQRLGSEHGVDLGLRVGVHTGLVVAGEMGGGKVREAEAIVGETPNIASRLQDFAAPNSLAISAATQELVEGLFECDDLGPQRLKGVSEAVRIYRVRAESGAHGRFEATAKRGLTSLVGREEEIGLLLKRWEQAKEGESQVALLSAEAGVGKSRIVRAFRDRLAVEPHSRVLYYCSPYHANSALYPVIGQLGRALRFEDGDGPEQKLVKLEATLDRLGLPVAEHAPVLVALLSLPAKERYPSPGESPEELKRKTLDSSIAVFAAMAAQRPLLVVVEDAHWIDPSTIELLNLLIERLTDARMFLVVTYRPEFAPPWSSRANVTALALNRFGRKDSAKLVVKVAGGKALPEEVLAEIVAKTDGVPLFVEELTKNVVESSLVEERDGRYVLTGPLPALAIPASLQDSLMARLDRLAAVKEVAQLAATLGRTFGHELLAAVSPLEQTALEGALVKLVDAGLVYRHGLPPVAGYEFKHALVRDAAYESLLKSTRRQHHRRIAEVLIEQFSEIAEAEPEVLAHHYTEADMPELAVQCWLRAGQKAIERAAHAEVAAHCSRGLELIALLPERRERDRLELRLRLMGGPSFMALKGFTSQDVKEHYSRARDLAAGVGTPEDRFTANWGLWIYEAQSGHHDAGQALVHQLLAAAEDQSDPGLLLQAHHCAWTTLYALDDLPAVLAHTNEGMGLYDFDQHRGHAFQYGGHDPGVCCYVHAGLAQWQLGFPDQAPAPMDEAVTLSERLAHPLSQVVALFFTAILNHYLRAAPAVENWARAMIEACEQHGFPHYLAIAHVLHGWAIAEQDPHGEGIAELIEALAPFRASGALVRLPYYLSLLGEAHSRADAPERALEAFDEALDVIERTGERRWEAEINRLKGEQMLAHATNDTGTAQRCLERALELARRQDAKSLELRAATSLARLWCESGKPTEARDLLAPVYGWFTEGFDTPDLKDAKALLDDLA